MTDDYDKEIEQLLNLKLDNLKELDLPEEGAGDFSLSEYPDISIEKKLEFKSFLMNLPRGEAGFRALSESPIVEKVERQLSQILEEEPHGEPFQNSFSQMPASERTSKYKKYILIEYKRTRKQIEKIYQCLASGSGLSYRQVAHSVEPFMNMLVSDRAITQNLSTFIYSEDDYLFNHLIRVCLLSINIAATAGFSKEQVLEVGIAALLADLGMSLIDKDIRKKKAALTSDEMYEVHKHPILGLHCLERIDGIPVPVTFVAYQHHERLSGVGYPKRRKGRFIHKYARIVAIADIFEAMCSERTYRMALNPSEALKKVLSMGAMNLLDKHYVKQFVKCVSHYPVGSLVKMEDNSIAKVVEANHEDPERPVIAPITDANGRYVPEEKVITINLTQDKHLKIRCAIDRPIRNDMMYGF